MDRELLSHRTTLRNSRRFIDRIFLRNADAKITSYFPIRKRCHEEISDMHGKRLRRGVVVSDVEFASPKEKLDDGEASLGFHCTISQEEELTCIINAKNASPMDQDIRVLTAFGAFGQLPPILFFSLFDSLDVSCLISLCMTSSAWTNYLLKYISSNLFLHRVQRDSKAFSIGEGGCKKNFFTKKDPFYGYGKLLKSVSVCLPTVRRVTILMSFCQRAVDYGIDSFGIGRVIQTMCSKWAFSECTKVLESLLCANKGRLKNILKKLEDNSPGSLPKLEMEFRSLILPLLLSGRYAKYEGGEAEYAFWLSAVMRCCSHASAQSKLIMILFGPTNVDSGEISTQNEAEELLKPLSDVLYVLMKTKQFDDILHSWTQHDVFNVIEELSTTPEPWSFENFVSLLLFRPALIPISITARMQHNYAEEACLMFNAFAIMSHRWNMDVCRIIRQPIMQAMRALAREQGRMFYNKICETYAQQLKQLSQRGQEGAEDLLNLMASHAAVAPLLQQMSQSLW